MDSNKGIGTQTRSKTSVYEIYTKEGIVTCIGEIKWYGSWRKYAFFPKNNTVFEEDCA